MAYYERGYAEVPVTFTRDSEATYWSHGELKKAAVGEPRFETDSDGNPLGILIEGASTNIVLNSVVATGSGSSLVDNPMQNFSKGVKLIHSSAGLQHAYAPQARDLEMGKTYTVSFYVRKEDNSEVLQRDVGVSVGAQQAIDNFTITKVVGSVYRVSASKLMDVARQGVGALKYAHMSTTTLYISGYQCEELPFASSYIPTYGSPVTRVGERVLIQNLDPALTDMSTDKTIFCDVETQQPARDGGGVVWSLNDTPAYTLWNVFSTLRVQIRGTTPNKDTNKAKVTSVVRNNGSISSPHYDGVKLGDYNLIEDPRVNKGIITLGVLNSRGNYNISRMHLKDFRIWDKALTSAQVAKIGINDSDIPEADFAMPLINNTKAWKRFASIEGPDDVKSQGWKHYSVKPANGVTLGKPTTWQWSTSQPFKFMEENGNSFKFYVEGDEYFERDPFVYCNMSYYPVSENVSLMRQLDGDNKPREAVGSSTAVITGNPSDGIANTKNVPLSASQSLSKDMAEFEWVFDSDQLKHLVLLGENVNLDLSTMLDFEDYETDGLRGFITVNVTLNMYNHGCLVSTAQTNIIVTDELIATF